MSARDYECPKCGADPGTPCVSLGGRTPAGRVRSGAHAERAALVPKEPVTCGTYAGYQRHVRNGEPTCEPCREKARERMAAYRSDPNVAAKVKAENAARDRAAWRLVDMHRDDFRRIYREELSR